LNVQQMLLLVHVASRSQPGLWV